MLTPRSSRAFIESGLLQTLRIKSLLSSRLRSPSFIGRAPAGYMRTVGLQPSQDFSNLLQHLCQSGNIIWILHIV